MAKGVPGWMKGCAVGCGGAVVLLLGVIALGYVFVKGTISDFEQADATICSLEEKFGPVSAFRPFPGGIIPPERMEAFIEARDLTATLRTELRESLEFLSREEGKVSLLITGLKLPGRMTDFITAHNDALLQVEMGPGEYHYIYTLAYYSWLSKNPADGPSFELMNEHGYALDNIENVAEPIVRERRVAIVRSGLNRHTLPILRNAIADDSGGNDEWRSALEIEIAALEDDEMRIPWEDGLPESLEASLLPYRDRLEASYDPMCGEVEVGILRR